MPKDEPKRRKGGKAAKKRPKRPGKASSRLGTESAVKPRGFAGRLQGITLVTDGNGRPTNLTPDVHAAFMADMREHADWPAMTAYRVGVSPVTAESWLVRGVDPYAVEPYRSFAADFVSVESEIHGRLLEVILNAALGRTKKGPKGKVGPNPAWAAWLLQHRWGYLWRLDKDTGKTRGVTVAEVVDRALARVSEERRDKARAIIAELSQEARAKARAEGFML
jgi:hypothetical protein